MKLDYISADVCDIEPIFWQLRELIDTYEALESIDYKKVLIWCRRQIEAHIREYTCVLCDGERAGYYRLRPNGERMELDNFFVLPCFRGRGIGTAVLDRCFAATELPVYLYAFVNNRRAMTLYSRMGFHVVKAAGPTRCILQRDKRPGETLAGKDEIE